MRTSRNAGFIFVVVTGLLFWSSCWGLKPPAGAFPESVGSLKLYSDVGSVKESDYIAHRANYVVEESGGNSVRGVIQYELREYPSKEQALTALEAQSQTKTDFERVSWEERVDGSGAKIGRVLVKDAVREQGNSTLGYCSLLHVRDSYLMYIQSLEPSCEPARKFLQSLPF
jgi:hypothetical protein